MRTKNISKFDIKLLRMFWCFAAYLKRYFSPKNMTYSFIIQYKKKSKSYEKQLSHVTPVGFFPILILYVIVSST